MKNTESAGTQLIAESTDNPNIPKRPGEARNTLADLSFSKDKLGYDPVETLDSYVDNWLEENKR